MVDTPNSSGEKRSIRGDVSVKVRIDEKLSYDIDLLRRDGVTLLYTVYKSKCFVSGEDVSGLIAIPDNNVVDVAKQLLSTGGKKVDRVVTHLSYSTKLQWTSFVVRHLEDGRVGYRVPTTPDEIGEPFPVEVLIHQNAGSTDPDVMRVVANECEMLAYLLNKFRFDNEFISEHAKSCAVYPEVMRLPEFKWKELPAGTYKIRGILKTGRAPYTLMYEEGDRKDELFLHNVEPTAQIDDSLLDTEVIATVLKLPDWSASLLAVEPYLSK